MTDLDEADLHIAQLRADLSCTPIVGVDVEYHGNVICLIQLSSNQRTIVLDAITLHNWMQQLLQPLLHDDKVVKVFHGDIKHTSSLNLVYDIMVNKPIFCVAEEALKLDQESEDGVFAPSARLPSTTWATISPKYTTWGVGSRRAVCGGRRARARREDPAPHGGAGPRPERLHERDAVDDPAQRGAGEGSAALGLDGAVDRHNYFVQLCVQRSGRIVRTAF